MRDRIVDVLGDLAYRRFLVYVMGPYSALDGERVGSPPHGDDESQPMFDLLQDIRDRLRADPGVNAFLAVDVDIPLEKMDAGTQSIKFALASNAVIFVIPKLGDPLGVGIEVGSVLEAMYQDRTSDGEHSFPASHGERVLFIHETGVRSAMIASVHERWDARVYSYSDRADLLGQVRLFVRDIARREQSGALPPLDDGT